MPTSHPVGPPTAWLTMTMGTTHAIVRPVLWVEVSDANLALLPLRHRVNGFPRASGSTVLITNRYYQ